MTRMPSLLSRLSINNHRLLITHVYLDRTQGKVSSLPPKAKHVRYSDLTVCRAQSRLSGTIAHAYICRNAGLLDHHMDVRSKVGRQSEVVIAKTCSDLILSPNAVFHKDPPAEGSDNYELTLVIK